MERYKNYSNTQLLTHVDAHIKSMERKKYILGVFKARGRYSAIKRTQTKLAAIRENLTMLTTELRERGLIQ